MGPLPVDGRYVAYLLNVQSFGHLDKVDDLEEILSSGAALVIVPRGTTLARQLREDRDLPVLTNNCSAAMRRMKIHWKSS